MYNSSCELKIFATEKGQNEMSKEYLTFKEAMLYMGFTTYDSLRNTIKLGLPVIRFGNSKRISKTAIDEFMKSHTVTVHPTKEAANNE